MLMGIGMKKVKKKERYIYLSQCKLYTSQLGFANGTSLIIEDKFHSLPNLVGMILDIDKSCSRGNFLPK